MSVTIAVRVRAIAELTERVRAYELVAAERGGVLPPVMAGAHIGLRLASGLERHYSLLDPAGETHRYRIAVQREDIGRGGSTEIHRGLQVGDRLDITPPRNLFPLDPSAVGSVLIGGGIGVTPILSMARTLEREGRPFRLVHLARDVESAAFQEDLEALRNRGHQVLWHFDGGDPGAMFDLVGFLSGVGQGEHVYCCGPAGLMKAVGDLTADWDAGRIHFEHFSNAEAGPKANDKGFTVHLARSGVSVPVAPDETILGALLARSFDVDYSCGEGTCGTCIMPLLGGVPDHRDTVLLPSERDGNIVLCCSRALSAELTIDL